MVIQCAAKTNQGYVRDRNEDYFADLRRGLFVICDGTGGGRSGEVASRNAIESVVDYFDRQYELGRVPVSGDDDFVRAGKQLCVLAVQYANQKLIELRKSSPNAVDASTTITLLVVIDGVGFVGHVGDSRLYIVHMGQAKQLTDDHTIFDEFSRINPGWLYASRKYEVVRNVQHVPVRSIGRESSIVIDSFNFHLASDDILLLCSDGLSNYFDDDESVVSLLDGDDEECLVEGLIQFANDAGGYDNATAVVIRVVDLDQPALFVPNRFE